MEVDQTVSVSKGVFVFKNNFKPLSKRSKHRKESIHRQVSENVFSNNVWYSSYSDLWNIIEDRLKELNNKMFSSVFNSLVAYVKNSHNTTIDEIPTAALLTGINMPDHGAQFAALAREIKQTVSPHVACLYSQDCQNLKYLMEHMVNQFINEESVSSDEEEIDSEENKPHIKKNQLNLSVLQCWYENMYQENTAAASPKKQKTKNKKKVLVVIFPDFESFNIEVLRKFILIASWYTKTLPFVFIFGIATSITTLHTSLPYQVSSKISLRVFNSQPSTVYLNNVLEEIFFDATCPFQLGGKVFNLFTDIFLFYDLSVNNFIQNIKFAMAEHFSFGNAMALCNPDKREVKHILSNFAHDDCENARHLVSFRKLVEGETFENRIRLLTDDEYFKEILEQEINKISRYIRRLHIFLKCLLILVEDLPKTPLGKQVRELYATVVSKDITKTPEYKECFQLLGFQSKEELSIKLSKIMDFISNNLNDKPNKPNKIRDAVNVLQDYLNKMNNFDMNEIEEALDEISKEENVISGQMDRKQLKEKLLGMSKQEKPMNRYERLRKDIVKFLSSIFEEHLLNPSTFPFYEIYFFDNLSIQNHIIGTHRSAIHNALNDPQYYLQCNCCEIQNSAAIRPLMPDICIVYKLHLECGKMINLYDWLQAFLSILDPTKCENDSKIIVDPELQARFTQAVAELEYLGFIKSSKRKADHVSRLTWGG